MRVTNINRAVRVEFRDGKRILHKKTTTCPDPLRFETSGCWLLIYEDFDLLAAYSASNIVGAEYEND